MHNRLLCVMFPIKIPVCVWKANHLHPTLTCIPSLTPQVSLHQEIFFLSRNVVSREEEYSLAWWLAETHWLASIDRLTIIRCWQSLRVSCNTCAGRPAGMHQQASWQECDGWLAGRNKVESPSVGFYCQSWLTAVFLTLCRSLPIHASMDTVCFSMRRNASESRKRAQRQQHDSCCLMKGTCERTHPYADGRGRSELSFENAWVHIP